MCRQWSLRRWSLKRRGLSEKDAEFDRGPVDLGNILSAELDRVERDARGPSVITAAASPAEETTLPSRALPAPVILPGKEVPLTTYTSGSFGAAGASSGDTVHVDRRKCTQDEQAAGAEFESVSSRSDKKDDLSLSDGSRDDEADGLHLPAGQHLLVDLKNVDPEFLNDEARLAEAMIELAVESELTLLSYHCHRLVPAGVSCAGILLESHVRVIMPLVF